MNQKNKLKFFTYGALLITLGGSLAAPTSAFATTQQTSTATSVATENAQTANNPSATSNQTKPNSIDIGEFGKMSYSGSAAGGLTVSGKQTRGNLALKLDISSLGSLALNDRTDYRIKLPEEFKALAQTDAFKRSISGEFHVSAGIGIGSVTDHIYSAGEITVDATRNELVFNNPAVSLIGLFPDTVLNLNMDLGQAVTNSGVHIDDAYDGAYHFKGGMITTGSIIDWRLGSRDSGVDLRLNQMDPGKDIPENTKPEINFDNNYKHSVPEGSVYDTAAALIGVSAYDKEDGWLTQKIQVVNNNVNTTKPGAYTVTYQVADTQGLTTVATAAVNVEKAADDFSLSPNRYNIGDSALTGLYGKNVAYVRLAVKNQMVANATLQNGQFMISGANKYITTKNEPVEVIAYDAHNVEQNRKLVMITGEEVKDFTLTANSYRIGDSTLTGSYGKDVYQVRLLVDGQVMTQASTSNGHYTFANVNKYISSKNQTVEVVAVDKTYQEQNRRTVQVTGEQARDYTLTANGYRLGNQTLTGSYGKDVYKVRLLVNGNVVAQADTKNGQYTFNNANKFVISKTQKIEVVAVDKNYREQNRKSVTVTGEDEKNYNLVANDYTLGDSTVAGSYGKDVYKVRLQLDGKTVAQAISTSGLFSVKNAKQFITDKKHKVEVVAVDKNYREQNRKTVKVLGEETKDYRLTADNYALGTSNLTGSFGKDVAKVRLVVNGQVVSQAKLKTGRYEFTEVNKFVTSNDDQVQVRAVNSQYETVNTINVTTSGTIVHDYALVTNEYLVGTNAITGTYGQDLAYVRIRNKKSNKILKQADLNKGNFAAKGMEELVAYGDQIEAVGVDNQYHEQAQAAVTVTNEGEEKHDYTLTGPDSFQVGTSQMIGTMGSDIHAVRLMLNGKVVKNAVLNSATGTYALKGLDNIEMTVTDKLEIVGVDAGYKVQATKLVNIVE
ncbi:immunoglobulin-like domain-containing protein [Latilactobacillus graminis]|nr:immunoglobulin-like domain-containing protein [Latilactobacillus graminis]